MNEHDTDEPQVLAAIRESLDGVTMGTPVEQILATGRTRLRRRQLAAAATGVVVAASVALGVTTYANPPAAPPEAADSVAGGAADGVPGIETVAYTVNRNNDGTVKVTWDKQRYFEDPAGLEAALRRAGFPVLIKVGQFCQGPDDDGTLDPSGTGPGVDRVVRARSEANGKVTFTFDPSAMPAGKQLFIGYLSPAQLAVSHGSPGSVERLISTGVPLTCTTVAPPPHVRKGGGQPDKETSPSRGTEPR